MHLPGPIRAAVGLAATAADELKHLPDRAIELPMLAVSTALQMSLRAQQRYARLAARGEELLNRQQAGEDPPAWATFDDPVSVEDLRRSALSQLDSLIDGTDTNDTADDTAELIDMLGQDVGADPAVGRMFESLFGVADPAAPSEAPSDAPSDGTDDGDAGPPADPTATDDGATATVTPISEAPGAGRARPAAAKAGAAPRKSARKTSRKTATRKTATKSAPITPGSAENPPAKKAPRTAAPEPTEKPGSTAPDKPVNKPRHTAPSKFDDAGDS